MICVTASLLLIFVSGPSVAAPVKAAAVPAAADYYPPPEAEGGWRSIVRPNSTPADSEKREILNRTGMDWDRLREAWQYDLKMAAPDPRKSLLVIRHGWIAFEQYDSAKGVYNKDTRVRFASGTKSLVGVGMARLFSEHKCKDTDSVARFMPASWVQREPARAKIQIRHVLSMSSGLEPYDGPYDPANYRDVITNLAVIAKPGKLWFYNTGALDLLNYVISKASGKSLRDLLNSEVMQPIGAGEVSVEPRHTFDGHGFCSFYAITPRDYARIGYLLLHHGRWKQAQIIDSRVVSLITARPSWLAKAAVGASAGGEIRPQENYAYTFWLNRTADRVPGLPADGYMASGGNHKMIVIPSLDMIVVRYGNYTADRTPIDEAYRMIGRAVTDAPAGTPWVRRLSVADFRNIPSGTHLEIEAERGICVPPTRIDADRGDPRVSFAWTPPSVAPNYDTPGGPAALGIAFTVPETNVYSVWMRTQAPDSHSDSYYLSMDGSIIETPWHTLVIPQSRQWQWSRLRTRIAAGTHVLEFRNRESGIKLDKIIIASDPDFTPEDVPR